MDALFVKRGPTLKHSVQRSNKKYLTKKYTFYQKSGKSVQTAPAKLARIANAV